MTAQKGGPSRGCRDLGSLGEAMRLCACRQPACRLSRLDLRAYRYAARRAAGGPPKAEPAADAGPAVPRSGAALIQ
jgi:hypothetical protein